MLYNNLLFFLGIYSWNYKSTNYIENILKKKEINTELLQPIKNNKNLFDMSESNSNSPVLSLYINNINLLPLNNKKKIQIYCYNIYSLLIFLFLCIQPIYSFYKLCFNNNNNAQEYLSTFLLNINSPVNYIWAKNYFKSNHFDHVNNSCNNHCLLYVIIIIIITVISIIISAYNINFYYNSFYYINNFNVKLAIPIIIIEWIYSRLIYFLTCSAFTIVFCNHVNQIKNFIRLIYTNEYDLENSYCLSNLITDIAKLRHSVEISIRAYNNLLSFITITFGISIAIFIRHKYVETIANNEFNITSHEYYLIQLYIMYLLCQIVFFYNVIYYSELRIRLVKIIQSSSFINKFLTRWPISKIKNKCRDSCPIKEHNKIMLCIEQENATSIDWMVLDKLTTSRWMDFSILGISSQDGSLIKKVITFSSLIYFVISYF